MGYAGAFTFEGRHDPFLPLLCAAEQTERIELITAIAVGFARSPLSLAYTAYDLQLASRGRFILGGDAGSMTTKLSDEGRHLRVPLDPPE